MKQATHSETDYPSALQGALTAFFMLMICASITYGVVTWRAEKQTLQQAGVQQNGYISAGSEDFLAGVGYGIDAIANTVPKAAVLNMPARCGQRCIRAIRKSNHYC